MILTYRGKLPKGKVSGNPYGPVRCNTLLGLRFVIRRRSYGVLMIVRPSENCLESSRPPQMHTVCEAI